MSLAPEHKRVGSCVPAVASDQRSSAGVHSLLLVLVVPVLCLTSAVRLVVRIQGIGGRVVRCLCLDDALAELLVAAAGNHLLQGNLYCQCLRLHMITGSENLIVLAL